MIDRKRFPVYSSEWDEYMTDLMVMKSAAGYYIGRAYWDQEFGFEGPYSRESGYYPTKEEAEKAFKGMSFEIRDAIENNHAYEIGGLPDIGNKEECPDCSEIALVRQLGSTEMWECMDCHAEINRG
jgi:hypothetical protein